MSRFELAIPIVLEEIQQDFGIVLGINRATRADLYFCYLQALVKKHPDLCKIDIYESRSIDGYDIEDIILNEVHELYRYYWWEQFKLGHIKDQGLATKLFYLAVKWGPCEAAALLQSACCELAGQYVLAIDGEWNEACFLYVNRPGLDLLKLMSLMDELNEDACPSLRRKP